MSSNQDTTDQTRVLPGAILGFVGNVNDAYRIVKQKYGGIHGEVDILYVFGTTPTGEPTRNILEITKLE